MSAPDPGAARAWCVLRVLYNAIFLTRGLTFYWAGTHRAPSDPNPAFVVLAVTTFLFANLFFTLGPITEPVFSQKTGRPGAWWRYPVFLVGLGFSIVLFEVVLRIVVIALILERSGA